MIAGCATPAEVVALARAGRAGPLPSGDCARLVELYRPQAKRLAFHRGRF